jgi:hypothetical protein
LYTRRSGACAGLVPTAQHTPGDLASNLIQLASD